MKRIFFTLLLLQPLFLSAQTKTDKEIFGDIAPEGTAHSGVVFGFNGNLDFPFADMKDRFGTSYRVGPSILYKTKSNFFLGAKFDFILGGKINEDSVLYNVKADNGGIIDKNGFLKNVGIFERGYAVGIQAGKLFSFDNFKKESGLMLLTGIGFIQHKINFVDKDETILPLLGKNEKRYDRLTNGWFVEQFAGYTHFGNSGFFNYHLGINALFGFTEGRRDYLYDVMRPGTDQRMDILFGIRGGWYIPIFKRNTEEIFY